MSTEHLKNLGETKNHRLQTRSWLVLIPATMVVLAATVMVWMAGCAANEPFDPESVENIPPVVNMSVSAPEGGELNPTSYFQRTFSWYGSDQDGWVQEYYVSIRNDANVLASWDTTTSTDTTMTFATDDVGDAEATFYLVCRDDRGALSDTLVRFIPLQNFPPAINFQSDFDPIKNMQRDITEPGTASADTAYWNWGPSNFRFFALDPDGPETMDDFYRYTLSPTEPTETYDEGDPLADPMTTWVRIPFSGDDVVRNFQVFVSDLPPGQATLTISVADEAAADSRFSYSWEVREPKNNLLYIKDNTSSLGRELYYGLLDQRFGQDNWDLYDFWFGFPDHPFVLLETMRLFEAVLWTDGGVTSDNLKASTTRDGVLESYLAPTGSDTPGRLLLISKAITGNNTGLPASFYGTVLGLNRTGSPTTNLVIAEGLEALGATPDLLPMATASGNARGIGLQLLDATKTEILYRMELCNGRIEGPRNCYGTPRESFEPIVAMRSPLRSESEFARVVGFSVQLEYFERSATIAALMAVLDTEMGVLAP